MNKKKRTFSRKLIVSMILLISFLAASCSVNENPIEDNSPLNTGIAADERFGLFVIYLMGSGTVLEEEIRELNLQSTRMFNHYLGQNRDYDPDRADLGLNYNVTVTPKNDTWENEGIRYLIDIGALPEKQGHGAVAGFPSDIEGYIAALQNDIEKTDMDGFEDWDIATPVTAIQVLNEPNWEWFGKLSLEEAKLLEEEKGTNPWDPGWKDEILTGWRLDNQDEIMESYWELLRITSIAAREANSEIKIVLGRGVLENSEEELIQENLDYFDYIDIHFYGTYLELENQAAVFMAQFGHLNKPIISYELGGPMKYDGLFNNDELGIHAEHVVQLHLVGFTSGIEQIYYAALSNIIGYSHDGFYNIGLIDLERNKKPAYYTYKIMKQLVAGFNEIVRIASGEDYFYKVGFDDKSPVFVLWTEDENKTVDLGDIYNGELDDVTITHIVTELRNGNPVYKSNEIVPSFSIPVGATPVFVHFAE